MTSAVSIKNIKGTQTKLQSEFDQAQEAMQDARAKYDEVKARLFTFNNKYGRVLQMMNED